jgi:hypothetical protein
MTDQDELEFINLCVTKRRNRTTITCPLSIFFGYLDLDEFKLNLIRPDLITGPQALF